MVHRKPPTRGAEKKKKKKEKNYPSGSKGRASLELGGTHCTPIRPCYRYRARAIWVPGVDGLIALGRQSADVAQVHLEGVRAPAKGLLDEVRRHAGDVQLDAGANSKRVAGAPLQLLWVDDG